MATSKLAELKKLTAFCRKNGIFKIKTADFEMELSRDVPDQRPNRNKLAVDVTDPDKEFPSWDSLTQEQRLLWSSTPPGTDTPDA